MSKAKTKARYIVTLGEMGTDEILDTQTHREFCGSSEDMVNQLLAELNRLNKEEIGILKAEVDRLRKAGDKMASSIQFKEEMAKDYNGQTIVPKCVKDWLAAKEGKQL